MFKIPYSKQNINQQDIDAVNAVLCSDYITQGKVALDFENALAQYCGAAYGRVFNSATSALHAACLALDVGPGDWVWTSPISFVASANCALYCGAEVDFVDIDPETFTLSASRLKEKLKRAEQDRRLPKVIIAVHMCGQPCDMKAIKSLADEYGIYVIEDAAHALGAEYCGQKIGACRYSDFTVFSFHPVKMITTGEGGAVLTRSQALAERLEKIRNHGITRDPQAFVGQSEGAWCYEMQELGFNYRMTDIQAALGSSQLRRLDEFVVERNRIARHYNERLQPLPLMLPTVKSDRLSSFHLYVVRLKTASQRAQVFEHLRAQDIGVNVHYIPIHTQAYFKKRYGFKDEDFPGALNFYRGALSLPLFPGLSESDLSFVVSQLESCL